MALLEVIDVSKSYGGVQALSSVSFTVDEGATVGVMGANGAGKTTLFSLIAGNEPLSSGAIRFRGESIAGLRPDEISRRGIARTFQIVRPFGGLSVLANVTTAALFGVRRHPDIVQAEKFARAVAVRVGLADRLDLPAAHLTLSGQKRLEVARAVATGAKLVLLDEVMAGLIPAEVEAMMELVQRLKRDFGLTIIVIEHVMQALMRLADSILVLHLGQRVTHGTPVEVAQHPDVLRAYLGAPA